MPQKKSGLLLAFLLVSFVVIGLVVFAAYKWISADHSNPLPINADAPPATAAPSPVAPPLPAVALASTAVPDVIHPTGNAMPGMAAGWPVVLPGSIISTPTIAHITPDGRPSIIVACSARQPNQSYAHPNPTADALLYALSIDGTVVPGWPIKLASKARGNQWGGWASSASVVPGTAPGSDQLIVMRPAGGGEIIHANRTISVFGGGDKVSNIPVWDLNGDGQMVFMPGAQLRNVNGQRVQGWSGRHIGNGYTAAVGDVFGTGEMCVFYLAYTHSDNTVWVDGFDHTGHVLPGWPKQGEDASWFPPVVGDTVGDGRMRVVAVYGSHLFQWNCVNPNADKPEQPAPEGVLVSDVEGATASPALADLDGSFKADIVIYDTKFSTLRAWTGEGEGIDNGNETICQVPGPCHGVSIVSSGNSGEVDFFTGVSWISRQRDGSVNRTRMIPDDQSPEIEWTQPTIADLRGDGKVQAIFGTSDGHLYVYEPGLKCLPQQMQWPTANQNFQHTGEWKPNRGQ